jgi:hypothetical protein
MARGKFNNVSITELQSEIKRRQRHLDALHRRREKLATQLREIEEQILEEGGAMGALTGRKRPRNEQNLADALASLLANKTLSVTEAAEQVQSAGYRTTSPNFRTIVNQTLLKDPRFKRVGRGRYTSKGSGGAGGSKSTRKKKRTRRTKRTAR